ncbi:MAG: zinc-ribbon domain-containing protein [Candidatus Fermentibacteraceae bacterium]|nr:zinc-ribbon domain-containing protein [Candidatus Fermentibacteraceae bacterium]
MIVSCPKCHSKYNIPEKKIGDSPKRFRCRKCSEIFIINPPEDSRAEAGRSAPIEDSKEERAARFARVLASDMLIYNKDLIDEARKMGNIPEVMGQEIQKSWELWKSRFPEAFAARPEIFSDALNQFLADGEKVFRAQDFS